MPFHSAVEHNRSARCFEAVQVLAVRVGHLFPIRNQAWQTLRRKAADDLAGLQASLRCPRSFNRDRPSRLIAIALQFQSTMAQKHTPTIAFQGCLQPVAKALHRSVQMPQTEWGLAHLQDRGAIEGCGAVTRLL